MRKVLSLILAFSLFLSSCSTLSDVTSGAIDDVTKSTGVSKIGGAANAAKKAVIPKNKEWNDGDNSLREDFVRNLPKAQLYLDDILNKMLSYSKIKNNDFRIYILRTARVQGMAAWGMYVSGTEVRITRGMFNMIYDEAEIACLIGHEIGHAALHRDKQNNKPLISNNDKTDAANSVTDIVLRDSKYKGIAKRQQNKILKTSWARAEEKEADKYGAELAAKAGYDPYAFCDLFERLASRVDLGLMYRFQKIEGSHPALDDRARSLREYLKKEGYKEGEGKRNRQEYVEGMSDLFAMRTGEGKKEDKKIQKAIDEEGKKDLKRLDEIFKEVETLRKSKQSISMNRFIEIIDEISAICKKYGITAEDVFGGAAGRGGISFMEESIVQDSPFWDIFKSIRDAVAGKVGSILKAFENILRIAPGTGDVIDLYEFLTGKDFFTRETLSWIGRGAALLGVLIGSGAMWRNVVKHIEKEASQTGLNSLKKSIDDAVLKLEKINYKPGTAYENAKTGGRHAKTYEIYSQKTNKELTDSISSHQKVVNEHIDKIKNPVKYDSEFYNHTKIKQDGIVNQWLTHLRNAIEQKEIKEGILKSRGVI